VILLELIIELSKCGILEISNMWNVMTRSLGWGLIKILTTFVDGLETTVTKIYTLNGFFNSKQVTSFIDKYKPLIWIILAISIAILGIKLVFNKKQNREHIPSNLIFSICVVVLLPIFMTKLSTMTTVAVSDMSGYSSTAHEIIKNNLYDLYYLDDTNYDLDGLKNNIPDSTILQIDINESLETKNISSTNKDYFEKKIDVADDGGITLVKLDKGWFSWDEEYYRYNIDFVIVIITLGTTAITLACIGLKVARLIFELAFNKLFATLFAFADIDDGKKVREIVNHIGCIFAVLFSMSIILKLYIIFNAWLSSGSMSSIDQITKIVTLIGVSIAVIDGPNIVERVLGIDAGLKSGVGAIMGGYAAVKGVGSAVTGAGKLASATGNAIGTAGAAAAGIGGLAAGAVKGNSNSSSKQSDTDTVNEKNKTLQDEMNENSSTRDTNSSSKDDNKPKNENIDGNKNKLTSDKSKGTGSGNIDNPSVTLQDQMNDNNSRGGNSSDSGMSDTPKNSLQDEMNDTSSNDSNFNDSMNSDIGGMSDTPNSSLQDEMNDTSSNGSNFNDSMNSDIGGMSDTPNSSLQDEMNDISSSGSNFNDSMSSDIGGMSDTPNSSLQNEMNDNIISNGSNFNDGVNNNVGNISENKNNPVDSRVNNGNLNEDKTKEYSTTNNSEPKNSSQNNTKKETRTLGQYVRGRKGIAKIERAYNIGKNTSSKWDLPKKVNNMKNRGK